VRTPSGEWRRATGGGERLNDRRAARVMGLLVSEGDAAPGGGVNSLLNGRLDLGLYGSDGGIESGGGCFSQNCYAEVERV
jgi:hypothetical protein